MQAIHQRSLRSKSLSGDIEDPASKRQRGRPKGSKNRRTVDRQDGQPVVSLLLMLSDAQAPLPHTT